MWGAIAPVGIEHDRHFGDLLFIQASLDYHLAGELHPRRLQTESVVSVAAKAAESTMRVTDGTAKEEVENSSKYRVADVSVRPGHRPRADSALKAITHHQIESFTELLNEGSEST